MMAQIVELGNKVLAAVTDKTGYFKARSSADELSQKYGLQVADAPMLIRAMNYYSEVRSAIRPDFIDVISAEYHGLRSGNCSYEIWHSAGSLATVRGIKHLYPRRETYGFMPISDDEWVAVGKGSYNGQTVARVHLEDAKKGNVPAPGTPYTIFVRLDKDSPKINSSCRLDYDTFMQDDRVLMITGSPDSREALAKMLFGKEEEGGEDWANIVSYHRINEVGFDKQTKGRLTYLDGSDNGLGGSGIDLSGRFVGVAPEALVSRESRASGFAPEKDAAVDESDVRSRESFSLGSIGEKGVLQEGIMRFGNYSLLEKICDGGEGASYVGVDGRDGVKVVVKKLSSGVSENYGVGKIRDLLGFNHSGLVPVREVNLQQGFVVTDYVEGRVLRDVVGDGGLPISEALSVVRCVADAVSYLQDRGYVHQDLSSSNVLVGDKGSYVLDFGLMRKVGGEGVKFDNSLMTQNRVAGTLEYMSREQQRGEVVFTNDVFSLGTLLFECLSGRVPYQYEKPSDVLGDIGGNLAECLDDVCVRALSGGRNRYDDIKSFISGIDNAIQQLERSRIGADGYGIDDWQGIRAYSEDDVDSSVPGIYVPVGVSAFVLGAIGTAQYVSSPHMGVNLISGMIGGLASSAISVLSLLMLKIPPQGNKYESSIRNWFP